MQLHYIFLETCVDGLCRTVGYVRVPLKCCYVYKDGHKSEGYTLCVCYSTKQYFIKQSYNLKYTFMSNNKSIQHVVMCWCCLHAFHCTNIRYNYKMQVVNSPRNTALSCPVVHNVAKNPVCWTTRHDLQKNKVIASCDIRQGSVNQNLRKHCDVFVQCIWEESGICVYLGWTGILGIIVNVCNVKAVWWFVMIMWNTVLMF